MSTEHDQRTFKRQSGLRSAFPQDVRLVSVCLQSGQYTVEVQGKDNPFFREGERIIVSAVQFQTAYTPKE